MMRPFAELDRAEKFFVGLGVFGLVALVAALLMSAVLPR